MKSTLLSGLLALPVLVSLTGLGHSQSPLQVGFAGAPGRLEVPSGERGRFEAVAVLPSGTATGVQAWSLSMSSRGCEITGVSTDRTDGAAEPEGARQPGGFELTELTDGGTRDCEGMKGAVCVVVLSAGGTAELPREGAAALARLALEAAPPVEDECSPAEIFLVNGCQASTGPAENRVLLEGRVQALTSYLWSLEVCRYTGRPCGGAPVNLIFQKEPVEPRPHETSELFAGMVTRTVDETANIDLQGGSGATPRASIHAAFVSQLPDIFDGGVRAWELSLGVEGDLRLIDATTEGTAGAPAPEGRASAGFEFTEIVCPEEAGGQGQGAVSAVLLTFDHPVSLSTTGTATVLRLTLEAAGTAEGAGARGAVKCMDGKIGKSLPQKNGVVVRGALRKFCRCQEAQIVLHVETRAGPFLRCDANDDGRTDISDAIWILNEVFRSGPRTECRDAADCDADGGVTLSDALFMILHQLQGGPLPRAPHPGCGTDERATRESCPALSTLCR